MDLSRGRKTLGGFWGREVSGREEEPPQGAGHAIGRGWPVPSGLWLLPTPHPLPSRRSWSSVKSCYRPVSPAQRMTAWIGETRLLPAPSLWEPQASCLPHTHEAFSQGRTGPCWCPGGMCQPISALLLGGALRKAPAPWTPFHARTPFHHSVSTLS